MVVNLDVMPARRRMLPGELAAGAGITIANFSFPQDRQGPDRPLLHLDAPCRELHCQPGDSLEYQQKPGDLPTGNLDQMHPFARGPSESVSSKFVQSRDDHIEPLIGLQRRRSGEIMVWRKPGKMERPEAENKRTGPLLELRNVTVSAAGKRILSGVSLKLSRGVKAVVGGPSGSGKSTLLEVILGGVPLSSGEIRFLGEDVGAHNIRTVRSRIAYVGQEPLLGGETARAGLLLPFRFKAHRNSKPTEQKLLETLSSLGLEANILDQPVSSLSGGEKQRLALSRALLLDLELLLLDEVTSALDPDSRQRVWQALLSREITLLAISHDRPPGAFDQTWRLNRGRLAPASQTGA